ncbi:hypothetical protein [Pararhodobacter sp.]|uniref:Flp family type IVb pilin n=1 Tax=Pararhodobacter sp. TaxID=2127056 RepID=UPI002B001819|nr:hypothetical protein [Pararhodobacter sp.]
MIVFTRSSRTFRTFLRHESGAVTVDWVVLTAAIVGLGLAAALAVRSGTTTLATDVNTTLTNAQVAALGCMGDGPGASGFECYSGPLIGSQIRAYAMILHGGCTGSGPTQVCRPGSRTVTREYLMSDGSVYKKVVVTTGNEPPVTTWTDANGNVVDAPPPQA